MIRFLKVTYTLVLIAILIATVRASLEQNLFDLGSEVTGNLWFQATLWDAYLTFLSVGLWVFYREKRFFVGATIFVLIMVGGNITIALYILYALIRLSPDEGVRELLLGTNK